MDAAPPILIAAPSLKACQLACPSAHLAARQTSTPALLYSRRVFISYSSQETPSHITYGEPDHGVSFSCRRDTDD